MNIILCGLPMSGKTTLGKKVAKRLNWTFIDTDHLTEDAYASTKNIRYDCRQIFVTEGEEFFRSLENEQINSLKELKESVIAIGGGSLDNPVNRTLLKQVGMCIYLKTSTDKIWEKMQDCGIPAYLNFQEPKKAFYEIAKKRLSFYEATANIIIEMDQLSEEEVLETIANIGKQ